MTTTLGIRQELVGLLELLEVLGRLSHRECGGVWMQRLAATAKSLPKTGLGRLSGHPVSYTHLTLPTILLV